MKKLKVADICCTNSSSCGGWTAGWHELNSECSAPTASIFRDARENRSSHLESDRLTSFARVRTCGVLTLNSSLEVKCEASGLDVR